jgi:hypothetical protein
MLTPKTHTLNTLPTGHPVVPCGHHTHVGTCPACQRRQMDRWAAQLDQATPEARRRAG